jgi:hypothetical protein
MSAVKGLLAAVLLIVGASAAQAQQVVCATAMPNTFVNGQIADANQVNANFNLLLGCANNGGRIGITTNLTFYVSPTGSDGTNTCLVSTAPCATITYAYSNLLNRYQFANQTATVTIQLANGTYNESVQITGQPVPGQAGPGKIIVQGNPGSPTSVVISGNPAILVNRGAMVTLQGMQLTSGTSDDLTVGDFSFVNAQSMDFGNAVARQIHAERFGLVWMIGNYTISGNAQSHYYSVEQSDIVVCTLTGLAQSCQSTNPTITIVGTPAFSDAFATSGSLGLVKFGPGVTFVNGGSATGSRYHIVTNAAIRTNTSGALVLPGSSAGTTTTGGVYD